MEQKYGEFVGVDNLYYAVISGDNNSAYTVGAPVYLAPVAEIAGAPEVNNNTTYYDNKAANNYVTEGKTELKVVVSNVPAQTLATLLGKNYNVTAGRVYDNGEANPPSVALGFRYNMGKDGYRYYWFLKGTFSGGSEDATSKSADVDVKTYELTFTAVTTDYAWTVGSNTLSLKRVYGDTSDGAFSATGWFNQVQTPASVGAPAAIALSSSVPADGASTVSRSSTVVLTFNNKIASEAISLINTSSGDITTITKSWDVTGKILTLTPSTQLAATTKYVIAINGVVDVFGQRLADVGRDFTTTA